MAEHHTYREWMRWLIRSTIVVLAVAVVGDWSFIFMQVAWGWLRPSLQQYGMSWLTGHIVLLIWIGTLAGMALAVDGYLRRWGKPEPLDVPRCKCGYPLVGLNEARCPECGEAI